MSEQAATEQLMAHIEALIVEHDRRDAVELVQGVFRSQIAINTQAELENRALREFVAAVDRYQQDGLDPINPWWKRCLHPHELVTSVTAARQRLATDHGLPLRGEGEQ